MKNKKDKPKTRYVLWPNIGWRKHPRGEESKRFHIDTEGSLGRAREIARMHAPALEKMRKFSQATGIIFCARNPFPPRRSS